MLANYRSLINFPKLVEDCWGILRGERAPFYRGTGRGSPAPVVFVSPTDFAEGYPQDFWESVAGPVLESLQGSEVRWESRGSRVQVEVALREALGASPWSTRVRG
jgi:hypothetical protein